MDTSDLITFDDAQRFWKHVVGGDGDTDACWPWCGGTRTKCGYGRFETQAGRWLLAHRVAYLMVYGSLPPYQPGGVELDHTCGTRLCCQPAHLQAVSREEHNRRTRSRRLLAPIPPVTEGITETTETAESEQSA